MAKQEGISINQFISSAVAEKISAPLTEKYLLQRAKKSNKKSFLAAMEKMPDAETAEDDKL